MTDALADLTAATFAPLTGNEFRIGAGDGAIDVRLAEVRPLGEALRTGGGFSLTFVHARTAASNGWLEQGMYPLTHQALGTVALFLVPIGPVDGGFGYEAVFT